MKYTIIFVSTILLQSQFSWGMNADENAQKCVSKSELVERVKQHLAESVGKFDETEGYSLVDRAASTRLGVSLRYRARQNDERNFKEWLRFQEACELNIDEQLEPNV